MARNASVALGGYYAFPAPLLPALTTLVRFEADPHPGRLAPAFTILDPCVGDGAPLAALVGCAQGDAASPGHRVGYLAAELEEGRARHAAARLAALAGAEGHVWEGDALGATWQQARYGSAGADLLYLNPPYDAVGGEREEVRFLRKYAGSVRPGGVLLLVVPDHVARLPQTLAILAEGYDQVAAYRFPAPEYAAFRQCVVAARKAAPRPVPPRPGDPALAALAAAMADPDRWPVLGEAVAPPLAIRAIGLHGLADFAVPETDPAAVARQARPFHDARRGRGVAGRSRRAGAGVAPGYGLELTLDDLARPTRPIAGPLTPNHLMLAVATGIADGERLAPGAGTADWPELVLKGRLLRVPVAEETDREGKVRVVHQPRLFLKALDVATGEAVVIGNAVAPSGGGFGPGATLGDVVGVYRDALLAALARRCRPQHDPADPAQRWPLPPLALPLRPAQAPAVRALATLLAQGENAILQAEVGAGKTPMALLALAAYGPRHYDATLAALRRAGISTDEGPRAPFAVALVAMPPHLYQFP